MTDAKDDAEDKPFKCKQCKERFTTEDRFQVHSQNHLKINTGKEPSELLPDETPPPTKFGNLMDASFDPFESFADVRNGETPSTTKPHLIIKPTLHTPVANILSPVFPTNLLSNSSLQTSTSALSLHPTLHTSNCHSPTYPKSPVPLHPLKSFTAANLASLEHLINNRIPKQEPDSPKDARQTIVDRIRKRADLPTLMDDSKMNLATTVSRKRFHSENNGQLDDKRRKFLERNRAAAQRCREKRKQWINNLQSEKCIMQEENNSLHTEVQSLRTEVAQLKCMLLSHKDCSVTKAMQDGKLPRPPIFPASQSEDIKKPSPTKPTPHHPIVDSVDIKPTITPPGANSDPLASVLEGFSLGKDNYGRPRISVSPLFGPHVPRSPMIALSPFALGPSFGLMPMATSVEPQYTITSLDSRVGVDRNIKRKDKNGSPQRGAENPCPEVVNGLAVLREALSKT